MPAPCRAISLIGAGLLFAGCSTGVDDVERSSESSSVTSTSISVAPAPTVSTTTTTMVASTTTTTEPAPTPIECVADWSLRQQVGQLVWVVTGQSQLDQLSGVGDDGFGGVVLVGFLGPDLVGRLEATLGDRSGPLSPVFAVDEEGGRVSRLENLIDRQPSARTLASEFTVAEVEDRFAAHAQSMAALGVDVDLAPVLDVGGGPGIGDRSFSVDPTVVVEYGLAVVRGLERGGIRPVVKHFPGHGRADADSHLRLPTTPHLDELRLHDLLPFAAAANAGVPAVMVGHLSVPGLTDQLPTSLSPETVTGLLRGELGFDGVVMTDALDMGGVPVGGPEAAELALLAGVDIAMIGSPADLAPTLVRLEAAVTEGRLDAQAVVASVVRTQEFLGRDPCSVPVGPDPTPASSTTTEG
ncbi:MAG: glycoside hydrolase family 3 protein [Actinomycetia bacterium]|nr:glycoside hydrolase family 3 protein [Actinomycetes bacterium]